jgi:hypothetical protein
MLATDGIMEGDVEGSRFDFAGRTQMVLPPGRARDASKMRIDKPRFRAAPAAAMLSP